MLSLADARERCEALIQRARRAGAEAGDAVYVGSASESVSVRLGALEDVERSESESVGLRVFVGGASASIGSTDLGDAALDELASRAVAMARLAPADKFAGLAAEELLLRGEALDLDLDDATERSPAELRRLAEEAEDAARAIPGVTNSEGGGASAGRGLFALATSHGFSGAYAASSHSVSASVVAGEGSTMQRDYSWRSTRHAADLPSPDVIGREAGERAVRRLNPGRVKSGPMPVVFDPRVANSLVGHLIGAMSGASIARRASFLLDRDGQKLFDSAITITDNPLVQRGMRSRPFDGEGLPTGPRKLVDAGHITGWLMDAAAARQLDAMPTGHASRGSSGAPHVTSSNVVLQPGSLTPAELMADIADGVYVTELIGHGVNSVTGDYSRGASGFRIVNGELAGPIAEFTVAGHLIEMFAALTPANDLEIYRGIDSPTLRVDGMSIAGD
ncbi:MAG: TldD/PmbA family protein [Novosphingobium sp.]|uniref:TldD/PmbA family protein n=1 Tax=Novosphingobium sp. TaxID=1874826 RepID=UPI002735A7FD|nr:TldD/PmbA family protein [Novosphingobium sp.]MDP3550264.1 TldD/PmbA family protein [Novosphingobium sp.]